MFQVENKNDLLLEKMCWVFLTWIVTAILVIAWLPRQPGQPHCQGSKLQSGSRRKQSGTAFIASFCQRKCIPNCLQAGKDLVTACCRAGTGDKKLGMAKAELMWDRTSPAFLSADDAEGA